MTAPIERLRAVLAARNIRAANALGAVHPALLAVVEAYDRVEAILAVSQGDGVAAVCRGLPQALLEARSARAALDAAIAAALPEAP